MKKRHSTETMTELRQRIRAAGLRSTPARLAVLRELDEATSPLSHGEVARSIADKGFDQATIYRNLVEMAEAGIVSRFELGDHVWRFESRRSTIRDELEHPHFLCVACGEVSCLPGVNVRISPAPGAKGSSFADVTEVLLKGHCERCKN